MRSPRVALENAQAVNEHYAQVKPNWPMMRFIHFALGKAMPVATIYEDGAEQMIRDDLAAGRQLFLAHNHQHFVDPLVLASMVQREKVLRPLRTQTVIAGRSSLFNNPYYGVVVRNSGAIPMFLQVDMNGISDPEEKARLKAARLVANESQVTITQAHMNRGMHAAMYPEGTRGRKKDGTKETNRDVTQLLPLHSGIGKIACGLERPENVRIVPIGTIYGPNHDDLRHATSYIARPFPVAETVDEVVATTQAALRQSVETAAALV